MDINYDGYYNDVKPIDAGQQRDRLDPELIKKVILLVAGALGVILLAHCIYGTVVKRTPLLCNRANANKDGVNNMMYLSKGLAVQKSTEEFRVSHCGKVFALGPEMARLWTNAQQAPKEVPPGKRTTSGDWSSPAWPPTTKERGDLAHYRLLSGCIICPELDSDTKPVQTGYDGRIWTWIEQAGLRLTASELIRLEEQGTKPVPRCWENRAARNSLSKSILLKS